jgi:hypothetical protein
MPRLLGHSHGPGLKWLVPAGKLFSTGREPAHAQLLSNGIKGWQTRNVRILNCDFRNPQFGGGGGNGYMYRKTGNETLAQDGVADFNRHGYVMSHMTASGNVFLRCQDNNTGRQTGLAENEKMNGSGSDHHLHFSHANLFDQCTVENSFFAAGWRKWGDAPIHGLTAAHSVYWNLTSTGAQAAAVQTQQGRYGYVIGTWDNKPEVRTSAWQEAAGQVPAIPVFLLLKALLPCRHKALSSIS